MKLMKRVFSFVVSLCIAFGMAGHAFADQDNQASVAPFVAIHRTPQELQRLVAPIALYPDPLVAQILTAATHNVEVVAADRWMHSHSQLKGGELAAQVDQQVWDASVKALTGFPTVLADMDQNVVWTSSLGDAYQSQPQQLMMAIQVMRQRASAAGKLEMNQQQTITTAGDTGARPGVTGRYGSTAACTCGTTALSSTPITSFTATKISVLPLELTTCVPWTARRLFGDTPQALPHCESVSRGSPELIPGWIGVYVS
jgi:hypothetical protein